MHFFTFTLSQKKVFQINDILLNFPFKQPRKKLYHGFQKNIKQHNIFCQHIIMISDCSCDTEDSNSVVANSALPWQK